MRAEAATPSAGRSRRGRLLRLGVAALAALGAGALWLMPGSRWDDREVRKLETLSIAALPELGPDRTNAVGDEPGAARLGHRFFFDPRFSATGTVACATCHQPENYFQDSREVARGVGLTTRNTMTVVGSAYSPWLFWDGRKDSLWAQALGPLESAEEHGGTRTQYALAVYDHYPEAYERVFGAMPELGDRSKLPASAGPYGTVRERRAWQRMTKEDRHAVTEVFVNIGKAVAAYERHLRPGASRFDRYVDAVVAGEDDAGRILDEEEIRGLELFLGPANCIDCHNGPLFTNNDFHNIGVPGSVDPGRAEGVVAVLRDEFNCRSEHSDDPERCDELRFLATDATGFEGAFRPPSLRNVTRTAPYMHDGQFATLEDVLRHYNEPPPAAVGHGELEPLGLSDDELDAILAFLRSLDGPIDAPKRFLRPPPDR